MFRCAWARSPYIGMWVARNLILMPDGSGFSGLGIPSWPRVLGREGQGSGSSHFHHPVCRFIASKESVVNTTAFVLGLALSDVRAYKMELVEDGSSLSKVAPLGHKVHFFWPHLELSFPFAGSPTPLALPPPQWNRLMSKRNTNSVLCHGAQFKAKRKAGGLVEKLRWVQSRWRNSWQACRS